MMNKEIWNVYLSGEIHSDWREQIIKGSKNLPVRFYTPNTDHSSSDACGEGLIGDGSDQFWYDHKSAKLCSIRNKTLIADADIVIVRFGEKYKQWNAAFDAGYAAALGKPLIVQHQKENIHALKEIDSAAMAVVETVEQIIKTIEFITRK